MKGLIVNILFVSIIAVFSSCKKKLDSSLVGIWKWKNSIGGFSAHTVNPTPNTIVTINFKSNFTYITYINGQQKEHGSYSLSSNQNSITIHFDKTVITDKLTLSDELISEIDAGKLTLYDSYISDGFAHYFEK